jgi:hypothetical protein
VGPDAIRTQECPLLYKAVINNCLWGFVRLPPDEEAEVDPDVLAFLNLNPSEDRLLRDDESGNQVQALTNHMTVFQRNIPTPSQMGPVLGCSSYIDDIAHGMASLGSARFHTCHTKLVRKVSEQPRRSPKESNPVFPEYSERSSIFSWQPELLS